MKIKILLRNPEKQLIKELHEELARRGFPEIRPAHSQVMQYVGNGARITELAEKAQMTKQSMSSLVYDMEAAGYIKRYRDKADNRAWIFKHTAKGQKAVAVATDIINGILEKWTQLLGEKKMTQLLDLLEELDKKISTR